MYKALGWPSFGAFVASANSVADNHCMSLVFGPPDFQPLENAQLSWRWLSETHHLLPDEARRRIRAFRPETAARLSKRAVEASISSASTVTFSADGHPGGVQQQLRKLPISEASEVVVSWDDMNALLLPWQVFCEFWDAFCYPSSDDVAIWSPDGEWALLYDHGEQFRFSVG